MIFEFEIPIFGQLIKVYQVSDIVNQVNNIITTNNYNLELITNGDYAGYVLPSDDLFTIHVLFNHSISPSIIVHETIHIASYLIKGLDIELSTKNEELLCYLSEYVFNQITEKIK